MFKFFTQLLIGVLLASQAVAGQADLRQEAMVPYMIKKSGNTISEIQAKKIHAAVMFYAKVKKLDPRLLFKMMTIESGFKKQSVSYADARGLLQVVPKWHEEKFNKVEELHTIAAGTRVGSEVIKGYLVQYKTVWEALFSYNGRNGRRGEYSNLVLSVKLPGETSEDIAYQKKIAQKSALLPGNFISDDSVESVHLAKSEVQKPPQVALAPKVPEVQPSNPKPGYTVASYTPKARVITGLDVAKRIVDEFIRTRLQGDTTYVN